MRIEYHDLSDQDFERLAVAICSEILGTGVVPFCSGPDGSRDARFEGTATDLPSPVSPFNGKFIAQAKHTEDPIAKFSDAEFSGSAKSSIISKEIPGIARLVTNGELDHYLLFSNRRMSGVAEGPIRTRIKNETGARQVELFGIERMDLLLKKFPNILATFGDMRLPLLVTPDDLAEVILAISANVKAFEKAFDPDELERRRFSDKNKDNGLSSELADYIRRKYMPQFSDVKAFLAKPDNQTVLERYESAAHEFQEQIFVHRKQYSQFDDVLLRVCQLLFKRDGDLRKNRALTKLVVYYMYWNCDIGNSVAADA